VKATVVQGARDTPDLELLLAGTLRSDAWIKPVLNWTDFEFDLLDPFVFQALVELIQQFGFEELELVQPG
jgi:hypothetical protein